MQSGFAKRGVLCHYRPCHQTTVRKVRFPNQQRLLVHQQTYHPQQLKQFARIVAEEASRRKFHGGVRAITGGALIDYGMDDPDLQRSGQNEMDRRTQANFAQFDEPEQPFDYLPAINSSVQAGAATITSHGIDGRKGQTDQDGAVGETDEAYGREEYVVHHKIEHPTGGQPIYRMTDSEKPFPKNCNPFYPFENPYDFKLGAWLLRGNTTNAFISQGFNGGILQKNVGNWSTSITSSYTLETKIDNLHPEFGKASWNFGEAMFWADDKRKRQPYYFRDPTLVIKHIFKQPAYRDFLAYKPVKEFNEKGSRIYSELYSGDWMWEQQENVSTGGTIVPTLVTSDQTRLSNHVGGHYFWPLYMSIGNLHSTVRNRPSNNGWILLAQLPVPPPMRKFIEDEEKGKGRGRYAKDGFNKSEYQKLYKTYKDDAFGAVIRDIFAPLQMAAKDGMKLQCSDGFARMGYPVMAAWLADFQEYNKIYTTPTNACCVCEVSPSQLGDNYVASRRDSDEHTKALQLHNHFRARIRSLIALREETEDKGLPFLRQYMIDNPHEDVHHHSKRGHITKGDLDVEIKSLQKKLKMAKLYFEVRQSHPIDNALWKTGIAHVQDVWKPDLLHTIYEGMVMHVLEALEPFLARHKRLDSFERAWMRLPAFNNIPAPRRSIFETEQRTGKALRDTLRQLLPVLVIALDKPTASQHFDFYDCLSAVRYLVDFSLICQYRYHTETSLGYLRQYLKGFHKHKNVFNSSRPMPSVEKFPQCVDLDQETGMFNYNHDEEDMLDEERDARAAHISEQAAKTKAQSFSELQVIAKQLFENDKDQLQIWLNESENTEVWDFKDVISKLEEIATNREIRFLDDGAYWKIPKLHLLSHFEETITRFGYLQQYSSEVGETLHKGIKEAYRICNKKDQTKQILQFHTRKFAVRMREMNLEALARDRLYEEDIQEALSLYGERKHRLLAAKRNRDGLGSIQNSDSYAAAKAQLIAERSLLNAEGISPHDEQLVPTDEPWYMPPPLPLFPKIMEAVTGRKLIGNTTRADTSTVGRLAKTFQMPHLASALRHFMIHELLFKPDTVSISDLEDLPTATWNTLQITTETVQMVEPLEIQKCVCSGPFRAPWSDRPRNDSIIIKDKDEYFVLSKREKRHSDFGEYRVATLRCLLQVQIPLLRCWEEFLAAGIPNFDASGLKQHNLAFIFGLQPIRYDNSGEMIPGALIGRCKVPEILEGLGHSNRDNLNATHNTQRKNDGRLLSVDSIVRTAHIVPQHEPSESRIKHMRWVLNNRSDLGMWDTIYSKTTERAENPDAVSETSGLEDHDNEDVEDNENFET